MQRRYSDVTTVASSTASVQLIGKRSSRIGTIIANDSTAVLYVRLGDVDASADDWSYKLAANTYVVVDPKEYNGPITGIWAAENGKARITEVW